MEPLLVGVTLFSLALAITMTAVAWKLLHHAREREAARAEALESLAFEAQAPDDEVVPAPAAARVMRVPPERAAAADEPRWDVALHAPDAPGPARIAAVSLADQGIRDRRAPSVTFDSASDGQGVGRRWLILAAVALVMIATVATLSALRSPEIVAAMAASRGGSDTSAAGTPLELLSLRNATDAGGQFTVTGLVQNPQNGRALGRVVAVVYLFDNTGRYFASGQAAVDATRLDPGSESPFVVTVPNAAGVGHYRVGFRTDSGAVVMHVDRRGQFPDGTTGDALPGAERATAHANASAHTDGDEQ